jgi:hypothetical protein
MTPLEQWFFRRRVEWAAQLILAKVQTRGGKPHQENPDGLSPLAATEDSPTS